MRFHVTYNIHSAFDGSFQNSYSRFSVHKAGLCCYGCVVPDTGGIVRESKYFDPSSASDCVYSLRFDEWFYRGEELVVAKEPVAKCFGGFVGFDVLGQHVS